MMAHLAMVVTGRRVMVRRAMIGRLVRQKMSFRMMVLRLVLKVAAVVRMVIQAN